MREEVWAIVRAAVEEALAPVAARQRELEARLERAAQASDTAKGGEQRAAAAAPPAAVPPGGGASSTAASRLAALGPAMSSIPVEIGPSLAPAAFTAPAPLVPSFDAAHAHPVGPRPSLPPAGTYGVTVMPSTRPSLNLDGVGAVDISGFDGGRRKRAVGTAVVVIMLLIVGGVVTMTLLSHS